MSGVTELVMDEFAIPQGHRYATVVIDPGTQGVLRAGCGRSRESVRPFLEQLSPQERSAIKGSRWLLLRDNEHVTREADRIRLAPTKRRQNGLPPIQWTHREDTGNSFAYAFGVR
jgi:hypothetical protein